VPTAPPGIGTDLDVHGSREVWVVVSGIGALTWYGGRTKSARSR
jgi:mannose-6-phosphate isomerase-like protein (cupin superfamily)